MLKIARLIISYLYVIHNINSKTGNDSNLLIVFYVQIM
ncbi:usher protein FimD, partial [Shigella flexneri]